MVLKGEWKGKGDLTACLDSPQTSCRCQLHQALEVRSPKARAKGHFHLIGQGLSIRMGPGFTSEQSPWPGCAIPGLQGPQTIRGVEEKKRPYPVGCQRVRVPTRRASGLAEE